MNHKIYSYAKNEFCGRSVVSLFEEQACLHPDKQAVVCNEKTMTYAQLNAQADKLSVTLQKMGMGKGKTAAVLAERGMEFIIGICAVLKTGGVYVPIDPSFPQNRINYILMDCKPEVLLTGALTFDASTFEILGCLLNGGTL